MGAFRPAGRSGPGLVRVELDEESCEDLAQLLDQVAAMLAPDDDGAPVDPLAELTGMSGVTTDGAAAPSFAPDDPAVARLLPDAHRDDPVLSAEFRRLTEHGLRRRKTESLGRAAAALRDRARPLLLSTEDAQALLRGLTDVRLVLAERLGLRTDEDAAAVHEAIRRAWSAIDPVDEESVAERVRENPWLPAAMRYEQLTDLQEDLVRALGG